MNEPFIPKEARPEVQDALSRRAWEVAFRLERLARGEAPAPPPDEGDDAARAQHPGR